MRRGAKSQILGVRSQDLQINPAKLRFDPNLARGTRNWGVAAFGIALAGCASSAADIAPAYVSPVAYQSYTCQQLALEARAVSTGQRRCPVLSAKDSHHHGRALATRCFRFDRSNGRALVHRCCRHPFPLDFIDVDLHLRQRSVTALDLVAWLVALDQISPDIFRYG